MCDTFGMKMSWTGTGASIFGKNSDREPDETQLIVSYPAGSDISDEYLECTYIKIPQVKRTNAILLSKPFWIWGAEMGVNERGVVIGNEAIFTKTKPEKKAGLIGMDLLRLALERTDTAREAANVIVKLLKEYGQSGPCGYRDKSFSYMNSFLLMDKDELFVLETIGRDYALKSYNGFAAISNAITITNDWDESSLPAGTDVMSYGDSLFTYFAGGLSRRKCNLQSIKLERGSITVSRAFDFLRNHNRSFAFNSDVCMHANGSLIRRSHTTGSMVVVLDGNGLFKIFVTAGSSPCITPFKPVLPRHLPADITTGGDGYDNSSFWWRHERFYLDAFFAGRKYLPQIKKDVEEIEARYANVPYYAWDTDDSDLIKISQNAFSAAEEMEAGYKKKFNGSSKGLTAFWRKIADKNRIPYLS
jgi:secernin